MNCSQCQENFTAYSAQALPAAEQRAVAEHLAGCAECQAQLQKHEQLFMLLDREAVPPAATQARFQRRLGSELGARAAGSGFMLWFQKLWPSRPAWAFSYSLFLLASGLTGGQLLPPNVLGLQSNTADMQQPAENTALVCPVQTAPSAWLPSTAFSSLT